MIRRPFSDKLLPLAITPIILASILSSALPAISQSRVIKPANDSQEDRYEQVNAEAENRPADLQLSSPGPGELEEEDNPIDDPWTWFCLVNFPAEELDDCINGIP